VQGCAGESWQDQAGFSVRSWASFLAVGICFVYELIMKPKFTIFEKQVKERDGESYSLENYKENYDYVRRAVRYGTRVIFRDTILEDTTKDVIWHVDVSKEAKPKSAEVQKQVVTRKYPNPRIVETDKGRVFVGGHGHLVKVGQTITVKENKLMLGRA
jgi:hypothetical protein